MRMVRADVVVATGVAVLVSACSGSTGQSPPSVASAASTPTPTSSAVSPSAAAGATATMLPGSRPPSSTTTVSDLAVRFPKTQRGAEDFVRFVMAQVSKAYATADPTLIQPMVDVKTCPDCARWVSVTTDMKKSGQHFEGVFVEPQSVHALTLRGDAAGVMTQVLVPSAKTVDRTGRTVEPRQAAGPFRTDFFLQFGDHWFVTNTEIVR